MAYIAAGGEYPGDLDEPYVIFPAQQPHPSPVEFTEVAALKGVDKTDRGRGVSWVDLNDGLLDLFTVELMACMAFSSNQVRVSNRRATDLP